MVTAAPHLPTPPVTCSASHAALKADPALFATLEQIGTMPTYDEPGQPQTIVMANCSCGSTLAMVR